MLWKFWCKPRPARLYVLGRKDLGPAYACCMAIHSAANLAFTKKEKLSGVWGHYGPVLSYLAVEDEKELRYYLKILGDEAVPFFEPDMDHALASVAYYGTGEKLASLPLFTVGQPVG